MPTALNLPSMPLLLQGLRPVERYTVKAVFYRRHLTESSDLQQTPADQDAPRWPVAWLLLRPAKYGPRHQLPHEVRIVLLRLLWLPLLLNNGSSLGAGSCCAPSPNAWRPMVHVPLASILASDESLWHSTD